MTDGLGAFGNPDSLWRTHTAVRYEEIKGRNSGAILFSAEHGGSVNYFWVPVKIIQAHDPDRKTLWLYTKIWRDIASKTDPDNRERYSLYV